MSLENKNWIESFNGKKNIWFWLSKKYAENIGLTFLHAKYAILLIRKGKTEASKFRFDWEKEKKGIHQKYLYGLLYIKSHFMF